MTPYSVSFTKNLKASNTWSVPSHMYLLVRGSRSGPNASAYLARICGVDAVRGEHQIVVRSDPPRPGP